jgi:hypothetical protein
MNEPAHDHASPGQATQQTVLDLARAILNRNPPAAHQIIADAACPSCVAIAGLQLGFTLCTVLAGTPFMSEPLRRQLLADVDAAERELRSAPN